MQTFVVLTLLIDAALLNSMLTFVADDSTAKFTKTTEIKFMPAEQASAHHPVLLEGTVTCVPEGWKGFFLSDEHGGVYCEAKDTESEKSFWPVKVGEKLTLSGVTKEGSINSFVQVLEVLKRSPGDLPTPKSLSISEIAETQRTQDANFVQVRGVMVRMINIANEMEYGLTSRGVECDVSHAGFRIDPKQYSYAEVEVSGVVIPHLDRDTFQLIVPNSSCFRVIATREELVAKTPVSSLKSVLENEPENDYGLVRFQAEIFGEKRDRSWLVDERNGVESLGSLAVDNANQRLGIIGIRHSMAHRKWIEYAEVVDFSPPQKQSLPTQTTLDSVEDYSMNQLVTWQGALVDRVSMDGREIQTFESAKGTRFSTWVLEGSASAASLNFGATYRVSGLVTSPTGLLQDRILVVRNFEDVHFESPPPLSNRARFLISLAFSFVLAIGLVASSLSLTLLKKSKSKLEQARDQLRIANETLEKKVELRTKELKFANEVLTNEAQIRMLAQKETLDFKARLEDAISLAELGSIQWDFVLQKSTWSEQSFRLHSLNSTSKSPSRTEYLEFVFGEDRQPFQEYLDRVASSFERLELRYRIQGIDGNLRWLHAISRAVRNDAGSVTGVESVIQEITELVTTEERLRRSAKMEAVGRLAAGLAHDLNNTLTIIQNSCYYLQMREGPDSENSSHLAAIQTATKQSANLTRQLITYSRQQVVQPVRLNLSRSIQNFEPFARQLLGAGFRVTYSLDENLQDAELDPSQFEQILMNLLINARDAMNDVGTIDIGTSMTEIRVLDSKTHWALTPEPGRYATLTIRDSGSGISYDMLDKIFEPYFTTKPIDRGTGLGLAVVHGIVKQHGGGIGIQSYPSVGTTFRIYFPVIPPADDDLAPLVPAISNQSDHDRTQSILLVDDEAMVLTSTKLLLESRGYQVTGVNSALAALQELERSVFDLLLTDISMPDMPGFILARKVSEICPNIPIVFMSGFLNEEAFRDELHGLQTRFIQKPFSISSLCSVIRETCA